MKSEDGIEYLIHIGIDTVKLQVETFTILIKEGEF
ncbi:PTS glucose transporter subunit IIA [Enterococcus gallinarum]